jgi:hypothetical protein
MAYNRILKYIIANNYNTKVEEDEMGRICNTQDEKRNACRVLMGKLEGKRPP